MAELRDLTEQDMQTAADIIAANEDAADLLLDLFNSEKPHPDTVIQRSIDRLRAEWRRKSLEIAEERMEGK